MARGVFLHSIGGLPGSPASSSPGRTAWPSRRTAGRTPSGSSVPGEDETVEGPGGSATQRARLRSASRDPARGQRRRSGGRARARSPWSTSPRMRMRASDPGPGRTRWAIDDRGPIAFFVDIADPARIVVRRGGPTPAGSRGPTRCRRPARMAWTSTRRRAAVLRVRRRTAGVAERGDRTGARDGAALRGARRDLPRSCARPAVRRRGGSRGDRRHRRPRDETAGDGADRAGAHTTALDGRRHRLYVFLPETHRAAVFVDE